MKQHIASPTPDRSEVDGRRDFEKRRNRRRFGYSLLFVVLGLYTFITLVPFYLTIIRAFVPTNRATEVHLWIPEPAELSMNAQVGNFATYYNVDLGEFKEALGIEGFLRPYTSLQELIDDYGVKEDDIRSFLRPYTTYAGWYAMLRSSRFWTALFGNVFVAVMSVVFGGFLGILTGSVLARLRKPWHRVIYNSYLLSTVIPPIAIMIPVYIIFAQYLHLTNSYWNVILMFAKGDALSIMVFTSYIATIPIELKESVEVDGGNRLHYLRNIIFPLSVTPFAVFVSIRLPWFWNDLLFGYLFLQPAKQTLMPYINAFSGTYTTNYQAIYAGLILSITPLILLYLAFRKLFVRSALAGSVKY